MRHDSQLLIGLDTLQNGNMNFMNHTRRIIIDRDMDNNPRILGTYIKPDLQGNIPARAEIVSHKYSTIKTMMANVTSRYDLNLVKKIHRFSQATNIEMKNILRDANQHTPSVAEACEKVYNSCPICAISGTSQRHKHISLSHVNKGFNE